MAAAKSADVVIYVGGLNRKFGFDSEGGDRKDIKLPAGQDKLLAKIVRANPRTVVVLIGGGAVEMDDSWLSRVPALLYAWYPGMEGGNALAHVLFGDVNPSGKLPCTFPKRLADTPAAALDAYPGENGTVVYKEGLLVGYRWYDTKDIEPLFPFGYGLSYTRFAYTNLNLVQTSGATGLPLTVEFEIANTGGRAGAEVAEIYVQPVNPGVFRPVKELKGFVKVFLQPGEKQKVSVTLDQKRLCVLRRRHAHAGSPPKANTKFSSAVPRATFRSPAIFIWRKRSTSRIACRQWYSRLRRQRLRQVCRSIKTRWQFILNKTAPLAVKFPC